MLNNTRTLMELNIDKPIDEYLKENFIKKAKVFGNHYRTVEACIIASSGYIENEYTAFHPETRTSYIIGQPSVTFID